MSQVWRERVGDNLRLLRERNGWTQADVVQRLRASSGDPEFYRDKGSISLIEKGQSVPPWDKMLQITRLFQTTLEVLTGLDPAHQPTTQYTTTVQGNAYSESVILGNPETSKVVEQVIATMRAQGVLLACPVCQARDQAQGAER